MASTYAPLPFSYLNTGAPAPKTGFRKEEGLYGSRIDIIKPVPALRHDQPRTGANWMLRGAASDVGPGDNANHGNGDDVHVDLSRPDRFYSDSDDLNNNNNTIRSISQFPPGADELLSREDLTRSGELAAASTAYNNSNFILSVPPSTHQEPQQRYDACNTDMQRTNGLLTCDIGPKDQLQMDGTSVTYKTDRHPRILEPSTIVAAVNTDNVDGLTYHQYPALNWPPETESRPADSTVLVEDKNIATRRCSNCQLVVLLLIITTTAAILFGAGFIAGWFGHKQQQQQTLSTTSQPTVLSNNEAVFRSTPSVDVLTTDKPLMLSYSPKHVSTISTVTSASSHLPPVVTASSSSLTTSSSSSVTTAHLTNTQISLASGNLSAVITAAAMTADITTT